MNKLIKNWRSFKSLFEGLHFPSRDWLYSHRVHTLFSQEINQQPQWSTQMSRGVVVSKKSNTDNYHCPELPTDHADFDLWDHYPPVIPAFWRDPYLPQRAWSITAVCSPAITRASLHPVKTPKWIHSMRRFEPQISSAQINKQKRGK